VHNNLCLVYRAKEERLRRKAKMWDVFLDYMDIDSTFGLAFANLELHEPILKLITFDDGIGDPNKGPSTILVDANLAMEDLEEEEEEHNGNGGDLDGFDYNYEI
jgi:hypothetical protein